MHDLYPKNYEKLWKIEQDYKSMEGRADLILGNLKRIIDKFDYKHV